MAALAVLWGHMEQDGLYMAWMPLYLISHEAVIVFFVLSGYVIAHSTFNRRRTWSDYAVARLARVYSVALPAILFSVVVGLAFEKNVHPWDAVSSFLFLNESWLNPAALPVNGPYWSLCYEVWYYLLFGMVYYLPKRLYWLCLPVAALAGPAILLLMPIWLLGVGLAKRSSLLCRSSLVAYGAIIVGLTLMIAIGKSGFGIDSSLRITLNESIPGFWRLVSSQRFITDYVIALAFALHLIGVRSIIDRFDHILSMIEQPIRYLASCTFSIYLFHRPMTEVMGQVWPNESESIVASLAAFGAILGVCITLAHVTEHRVKSWRAMLMSAGSRSWLRTT